MRVDATAKWVCAGWLLFGAMACAQAPDAATGTAPGAVPDWIITSSPARFVVTPDPGAKPAAVSAVNLCVPNPSWLNAPIRVFADNGAPVGCDLLWAAPDEPATLLFDSSSGSKQYKVYVGSNWPAVHLANPQSGVMLESRALAPGDFSVLSATFGHDKQLIDVTGFVKNMVHNGRLAFQASERNLGNQHGRGVPRTFEIKYTSNGQTFDQSFKEDEMVYLPKGAWVNSLDDMLQAWQKSPTVLGRAMVGGIFEGGNRFGVQQNCYLHFQGWFDAAAPEHLQFGVASYDTTYVLVDGKVVIAWPSLAEHQPAAGGRYEGGVDVTPGTHLLECYVDYVPDFYQPGGGARNADAYARHSMQTTVGVKTGTPPQWIPLAPGNIFLRPSGLAHVTGYQLQTGAPDGAGSGGSAPPLVIGWMMNGQSIVSPVDTDVGLIAVQLNCWSALTGTVTWTFDDGTTAQGPSVLHLFPRPGLRTVKVSLKDGPNDLGTVTQVINVHPNWELLNVYPPQLFPQHHDDILARDPSAMSASDLASCAAVFGTFKSSDGLLKILPALCAKMKDIPAADLGWIKTAGVYLAQEEPLHSVEAAQLLQALVDRCAQEKPTDAIGLVANRSRLALAEVLLKTTDQAAPVKALLDGITHAGMGVGESRQLAILKADLALATGDVAGARQQYETAMENMNGPDTRSSIRFTARIGMARTYIEQKDYLSAEDALAEVADEAPLERMAPDWSLLRLRLYQEEGQTGPAYIWATRLLPVITDNGRSELLFRLTDLAFAQGRDDVAKKSLAELMQKYPYSEQAAQAKEKWPGKV
jgi:tetratricopeptide (TPR) repeat protein